MKALIVTLAYRQYGKAIQSHLAAARAWDRRFDWLYLYGLPTDLPADASTHDIVTRKYQDAQRVFLQGDYDTFISIEDDMVIPPDTFSRLQLVLDNGADIAYGLYCWRYSRSGGGWCTYTDMQGDEGHSILTHPELARQAFREQRVVDVIGVGMGCTAIQRHVLQAISFSRQGQHCNDWYLATDAQDYGYISRCDMGLVCGHITMNPSPRIIYPDIQDETYQRIDYL